VSIEVGFVGRAEVIARVALCRNWHTLQHTARVVALLGEDATDYERATAWLHDVLEDSDAEEDDLRDCGIPELVVDAVTYLTRGREPYEEYARTILTARGAAGALARRVKLADAHDNLARSLEAEDVQKWRSLAERRYRPLIEALTKAEEVYE
jgi:hypothetical protein